MVYPLFKFLHIIGAIVWIGGLITLSVINARVAREQDSALLASMQRQSRFFGASVVGPAAVLTLVAGIVMIAVSGLGAPLWVIWGFVAILLSLALGATLIRRDGNELSRLMESATPGDTRVAAIQRRLGTLNIINVLLLLSTVWAMVFKPSL